jgi:hypothetical protein
MLSISIQERVASADGSESAAEGAEVVVGVQKVQKNQKHQ